MLNAKIEKQIADTIDVAKKLVELENTNGRTRINTKVNRMEKFSKLSIVLGVILFIVLAAEETAINELTAPLPKLIFTAGIAAVILLIVVLPIALHIKKNSIENRLFKLDNSPLLSWVPLSCKSSGSAKSTLERLERYVAELREFADKNIDSRVDSINEVIRLYGEEQQRRERYDTIELYIRKYRNLSEAKKQFWEDWNAFEKVWEEEQKLEAEQYEEWAKEFKYDRKQQKRQQREEDWNRFKKSGSFWW